MAQSPSTSRQLLTNPQRQALREFSTLLAGGGATPQRVLVINREGQQAELSLEAVDALTSAIVAATRVLADDSPFAALPDETELSPTKAARFLRVSRQYFARMLDQGVIPYQVVGTHQRIRIGQLRDYKQRQQQAIRDLAQLSEDLGIYDE